MTKGETIAVALIMLVLASVSVWLLFGTDL